MSCLFLSSQDGLKPIQVAAGRGNRAAVEILFPKTTQVHSIPKWSVDGIIEYMRTEAGNAQVVTGT